MSLLGNYETASVYYQGVIQQIHRLLSTIDDPSRKHKWQQIQGEVAQEYDVVKNIMQTLALFKGGETHDARQVGPGLRSFQAFEEPTRDPDVWPAPPPRDNVWSSGSSNQAGGQSVVKPVRGPRKDVRNAGGSGGTGNGPTHGGSRTSKAAANSGSKRSTAASKASGQKGTKTEADRGRRGRGMGAGDSKKDDKTASDKVSQVMGPTDFMFSAWRTNGMLPTIKNRPTVLPRLERRRTIKLMSFLIKKKIISFEQFLKIFGIL